MTFSNTPEDRLAAIRVRQDQLLARSRELLDGADRAGREITPAEAEEIDRARAEMDGLGLEVTRIEMAMGEAPSGRRTQAAPIGAHTRPDAGPREIEGFATPSVGRTFAAMFGEAATRDAHGWPGAGEFLATVCRGQTDSRLRAASNESTGSSGGFLVPQPVLAAVLDQALRTEVVRPRARVFPMTSASARVPMLDTTDRSQRDGREIAKVRMQFLGELADGEIQVPKFTSLMLHAKKGAIFGRASIELLEDAPNFAATLVESFATSAARGLDWHFLNGTGAGTPLGIKNSPALIKVDEESGQAPGSLMYSNVVNMFSRMLPSSIGNSIWIMHPSVVPALLTANFPGTSPAVFGSAVPIQLNQLPDGSFSLLGRPVIISDLMSDLGDEFDIAFLDLSYYAVGLRKSAAIERSNAVAWTSYAEDFRLVLRLDGQPLISEPITPANGSTLSPFVTMVERA